MRDTTTITITVRPTGTAACSRRGSAAACSCASPEPLLAAARVLIAEGWHPDALLVMRHRDAGHDALRAKLKVAARLTVEDGPNGAPRFRRWRAPRVWGVAPPMRFPGEAVPEIAGEPAEALGNPTTEVGSRHSPQFVHPQPKRRSS